MNSYPLSVIRQFGQGIWCNKKLLLLSSYIIYLLITGCFQHYYKVNSSHSVTTDMLQRLKDSRKYFVLHLPDRNVGRENVKLTEDRIEGDPVLLSENHTNGLKPKLTKSNVVIKSQKDSLLMEVHLYTAAEVSKTGRISVAVNDINRIDLYEFDAKTTKSHRVSSIVGLVVGSAIVIGLVAFLVACNCPQVYIAENGNNTFNGGLYSGAVYSTLERSDYMYLPVHPPAGEQFQLSIANATDEEQFINSVALAVV